MQNGKTIEHQAMLYLLYHLAFIHFRAASLPPWRRSSCEIELTMAVQFAVA